MFATRWQPLNWNNLDWRRLQGEMERAFEHLTGSAVREQGSAVYPALNMWEDDEQFLVEAELPGLDLESLEVSVDGENHLVLKGERKGPEQSTGRWYRQERGFGSFQRQVALPREVDTEHVSAEYTQGILTVSLPKKPEVKPRRIEVQVR